MRSFTIAMRLADTNILLYSVSPLPEEAAKQQLASQLLDEGDLALSAQVLQEFYVQATHPSRTWRFSHERAIAFIETLLDFPIQPVNVEVLQGAFALRARFGLSYWDCAILAAARLLGCDAVYSEDMSDTQDYDGLRVINPFAPLPRLA